MKPERQAWEGVAVDAAEARALFRLGRYGEAADLALGIREADTEGDWAVVAGMAALGGRVHASADAYQRVPGAPRLLSNEAHVVRLRLDAFAGVGAPTDSIQHALDRLTVLVSQSVPVDVQGQAEVEFVRYLRLLAAPVLGLNAVGGPDIPVSDEAHWFSRLRRGDLEMVRASLRALEDERRDASRTVAPMAWADYWALAAAGDTAGAMGGLDILLARLPTVAGHLFEHPADAAAAGRAMKLRAELAHAVGDRVTADRWARAVRDLWRHADPAVQASIEHLDALVIPDRNRR